MRRVILVAGPPCAGKTTHVAQRASRGDLVLDQDAMGVSAYRAGMARVAAMTTGTAWVIRCAPGPSARRALADQIRATDVVLLVPPRATLNARAAHRPAAQRARAAITAWFRTEQQDRGSRPPGPARAPKSTTERGYGASHQARRAALAPKVAAGLATCWRCLRPIGPGQAWDLGHDDNDRKQYRGPEHRHRTADCVGNRSAGATHGNRARARAQLNTSQRW